MKSDSKEKKGKSYFSLKNKKETKKINERRKGERELARNNDNNNNKKD